MFFEEKLWFPYFIILLYYYIYYNNTYYLFFEKELVIISLLHYFINRVSLNCEFSSLIFLQHSNSWTKHLEYFRSSFQKDGALVFQRSWNRCATTSCRKTCRPSCTWWTTRSTGGARPAPNTFCSWPVTWGFRWSRGTRITRDWREWVDANLPFPFLSRLWRVEEEEEGRKKVYSFNEIVLVYDERGKRWKIKAFSTFDFQMEFLRYFYIVSRSFLSIPFISFHFHAICDFICTSIYFLILEEFQN